MKEKIGKPSFSEFGMKLLTGNKAPMILIVLMLFMAVASPVFFTQSNLFNVIRQVAYSAILATGFTLILASGGIDLSLGYMVGLIGIIIGKMLVADIPVWVCIVAAIGSGALFGAFNASVITIFSLPPFIVTLAIGYLYKGAIYLVTKMVPISGLPASFKFLGQGYLLGIPVPVYILVAVVLIMHIIIHNTKFGRHALAMGGNANAARVSGININWTRLKVYMVMGMYAAVAAIVLTSRTASAQISAGEGTEMDAVAAVVLGGNSMAGGKATVLGTLVGCIIVGIINNGLNLLQVDSNWQVVAKGVLILFAIILDAVSTKAINKRELKRMAELKGE